jgi:hypothetical protein
MRTDPEFTIDRCPVIKEDMIAGESFRNERITIQIRFRQILGTFKIRMTYSRIPSEHGVFRENTLYHHIIRLTVDTLYGVDLTGTKSERECEWFRNQYGWAKSWLRPFNHHSFNCIGTYPEP